jgi:hypothetical protein
VGLGGTIARSTDFTEGVLAVTDRLTTVPLTLTDRRVPGDQFRSEASGLNPGLTLEQRQTASDPPHRLRIPPNTFGHPRLLETQLGPCHRIVFQ